MPAARRVRSLAGAWLAAVAILSAAGGGTGAGARAALEERCFGADRVEVRLAAPAPGDTLRLPHRLISPSSLTLRAGGQDYRQGLDFELLALTGEIVWLGPAPAESTGLIASYRYLPLRLSGRWGREVGARPETLAARALLAPKMPELPQGARLEVGGSKTFSLEFGSSRDAQLEQSLDLTLRGQLAESVQVRAVLTDRATPLQPEGTSTELRDLDQVLIEVDAPRAALRLGDVQVEQSAFTFLHHRREMEGLTVRAGRERGTRAGGAFGRGLGRYVSLEFFGEEGKQGPYRLLAQAAETGSTERLPGEDAVVVAGSERVWLNGARLRRGEEFEYTIDYDTGELWFTPRRAIGTVSEIRVDFQVREGAFDRDYAAFSATSGDSGLGLAVAWMRERDDAERAAAVGLSDAERDSLAAAGDAAGTIGGGVVADSLGDYALVEADTLAAPFFLYVREDPNADSFDARFRVTFTDIGEGAGDYARAVSSQGNTYYAYVGRKEGRYLPGRRITSPELRDVVSLRAGGPLGAGLILSAEGALSRHDLNTLSARGDADNQGGALSVQGSWMLGELWGGRSDVLELRASGRGVEERFSPPELLQDAFESRRWNASSDSVLNGRDRRGAVGLTLRPASGLDLSGDWEKLSTENDFSGSRWHLRARREGRLSGEGEAWSSRTEEAGVPGRARRMRGALAWTGAWGVGASYESERLLRGAAGEEQGEAFELYGLQGRTGALVPGLQTVITMELRADHRWEQGRREHVADRRLYQAEADFQRGGTLIHTLYARRTRADRETGEKDHTDLADWVFSHRGLGSRLSAEWRGRVTAAESRLRSERLRYVGGQGGHYDSLGHYVGQGDYELYYQPGDSAALENHLESVLRLSGRPLSAGPADASFLGGFETTLFGRIELASGAPLEALLRTPEEIWSGGEECRTHERTWRGDLSWKGPAGAPVPTARVETRRTRERTALEALRSRLADRGALELLWTIRPGLRGRIECGREREGESVSWAQSGARSFDEREVDRLGMEANWTLIPPLTVRVQGEARDEDYQPSEQQRRLYRASWGAIAQPTSGARLELVAERRWAAGEISGYSPFLMDRPGWRLTCTGSLRPKPGLTGSLWIRIDREDDRDTVVSGRMDARAYF